MSSREIWKCTIEKRSAQNDDKHSNITNDRKYKQHLFCYIIYMISILFQITICRHLCCVAFIP